MSWLSNAHNANEMGPIGKLHKRVRGVKDGNSKKKKKSSKGSDSGGDSGGDSGSEFDSGMFQRNLLDEGRQALQLMDEATPRILANNQKYGKDFAKSEVDIATERAKAEAASVAENGGKMRQAILDTSPEIAKANQSMMDRLDELGPSEIEKTLKQQALSELQMGGDLSAEDKRSATQQARAAMQSRGMDQGRTAGVAEVLNRQEMVDLRKGQRRGFAGAVDASVQARKANDATIANNATNTLGAFWDPQNRMFGRGGSQVSGQVGMVPYQSYLGASQDVGQSNQSTAMNMYNAEQARQQDQSQFDAMREDSKYYSMLNMQNGNAQAAAARKSAQTGAYVQAGATILAYAALAFL